MTRARTHEHVLEQIERQIVQGTLHSGDRLPSERALTELLDVGRSSVREALRILESIGIIRSTGTRGSDAGWVVAEDPSPALGRLLRLQLALSRFELVELVETRIRLEKWACEQAAVRGGSGALDAAGRVLEAMDDDALSPADFNYLDTEFHIHIAVASGNTLLADLMRALRDAVEREMVAVFEGLEDWHDTVCNLRAEHHGIFDAIGDGDGERAARLVEEHIWEFYKHEVAGRDHSRDR